MSTEADDLARVLAGAIGKVFAREKESLRSRGYTNLTPQIWIFDAFLGPHLDGGTSDTGLRLAKEILAEAGIKIPWKGWQTRPLEPGQTLTDDERGTLLRAIGLLISVDCFAGGSVQTHLNALAKKLEDWHSAPSPEGEYRIDPDDGNAYRQTEEDISGWVWVVDVHGGHEHSVKADEWENWKVASPLISLDELSTLHSTWHKATELQKRIDRLEAHPDELYLARVPNHSAKTNQWVMCRVRPVMDGGMFELHDPETNRVIGSVGRDNLVDVTTPVSESSLLRQGAFE